jgi:hypothetical protein
MRNADVATLPPPGGTVFECGDSKAVALEFRRPTFRCRAVDATVGAPKGRKDAEPRAKPRMTAAGTAGANRCSIRRRPGWAAHAEMEPCRGDPTGSIDFNATASSSPLWRPFGVRLGLASVCADLEPAVNNAGKERRHRARHQAPHTGPMAGRPLTPAPPPPMRRPQPSGKPPLCRFA